MKRLSNYSGLGSDEEFLTSLLGEWKPIAYDLKELDHEIDLEAWLRRRLPDVPILTQYGIAKGRADIVVEDKHAIELKVAFTSESVAEFDRCIGQLFRYRKKWVDPDRGPVYLVVVGESEPEFRDLLHAWFKEANASYWGKWFYLIEKRPSG